MGQPPVQGRRPAGGGPDPKTVFASALERLLAVRSVHEITLEELLAEAGLSRSTFYGHFASKFEVLEHLTAEVYDELFESIAPWRAAGGAGTRELLRESLRASAVAWARHGGVLVAAAETVHVSDGMQRVVLDGQDRATRAIAEEIDRERAVGRAPADGPSAAAVAAVLAWGAERLLYVGQRGFTSAVHDVEAAAALLQEFGTAAVYGASDAR